MLICHKLVASNGTEVLQACHMSDVHANIGSVYHASIAGGCVPSTSFSLIYHLCFSNTITRQRRITTTAVA